MVSSQRGERVRKGNEITGYQACSLVNQLVKRMLTIGTRLAPEDRAGIIIDGFAVEGYVFANPDTGQGAIREAIRAGWDPESRGRAFRYEVADSI